MSGPLFEYRTDMTDEEKERVFLLILLKLGSPPWDGIRRSGVSVWARAYKREAHQYLRAVTAEFRAAMKAGVGATWTPTGLENRARHFKNAYMEWCIEYRKSSDCDQDAADPGAGGGTDGRGDELRGGGGLPCEVR